LIFKLSMSYFKHSLTSNIILLKLPCYFKHYLIKITILTLHCNSHTPHSALRALSSWNPQDQTVVTWKLLFVYWWTYGWHIQSSQTSPNEAQQKPLHILHIYDKKIFQTSQLQKITEEQWILPLCSLSYFRNWYQLLRLCKVEWKSLYHAVRESVNAY